jgi:hypothetical protein
MSEEAVRHAQIVAARIRNLTDRIDEGRANGWFGEVQGLQISHEAARAKLVGLDRASRSGVSITQLGIPMIRNE